MGDTKPVGAYPAGVSPYGLADMAGNVWEWTADWYNDGYYSTSPDTNPQGPASGTTRVLRGGSFYAESQYVRCAARGGFTPVNRSLNLGFRVVAPGFCTADLWNLCSLIKALSALTLWRGGGRGSAASPALMPPPAAGNFWDNM